MAKKSVKKIDDVSEEQQKALNEILGNSVDYVTVRGHRWKFKWLRNGTKRKITDIMLTEEDEDKVVTKCIAAARLNGYWSIKFFYWILWRWMFYIEQYTYEELIEASAVCKKKAPLAAYFWNITSLTEMKDTMMTMTRAEVERIRQEQLTAQLGQLAKSTKSSQTASTTSEDSSASLSGDGTGDTPQHS